MSLLNIFKKLSLLVTLLCCGLLCGVPAQDPKNQNNTQNKQDEEVLRISSDLIQTGVSVFDKKGQFIDKLTREDFELRVDGKPVPISFFQRVSAESDDRKINTKETTENKADEKNVTPWLNRTGRTIIFVVDDVHLSFDGIKRTKELILKFIDAGIAEKDLAAIVSSSGKLGPVQQFTNSAFILRSTAERIQFSNLSASDRQRPPMSEFEAQLIDRGDAEATRVFAELLAKEAPDATRVPTKEQLEVAEEQLRSRARSILTQAGLISKNTYSVLEQAINNSAKFPGRKVVFFISDGFLLDASNTDSSFLLRRITDAAVRANAVIYSLDAKGLDADLPDGTTKSYRIKSAERFESQDGPNILAENTGGRLIKDTNDLQAGVSKALAETSLYYLIAWQPDEQVRDSEKFRRIEIKVKNRPDLAVNSQSGYLDQKPKASKENIPLESAKIEDKKVEEKKPVQATSPTLETQLKTVTGELNPKLSLAASLAVDYLDTKTDGALLSAALRIEGDDLEFTPAGDKSIAEVDLTGFLFNASGKQVGSFKERLAFNLNTSDLAKTGRSDFYYNVQNKVKPGKYQMGIAARDVKSGRTGSVTQWIEIPDLTSRRLALSSLLIGEQISNTRSREAGAIPGVPLAGMQINVDRQFERSSNLQYMVFIYNAAKGTAETDIPDLTLQTQVMRGTEVVMTTPPGHVSIDDDDDTDMLRLPYAAEISLNTLPPGRYELQVKVEDRIAKTSALQTIGFVIK